MLTLASVALADVRRADRLHDRLWPAVAVLPVQFLIRFRPLPCCRLATTMAVVSGQPGPGSRPRSVAEGGAAIPIRMASDLPKDLERRSRTGTRLLVIAVILAAVGAAMIVVSDGPLDVIGSLAAALGTLTGITGLTLVISALIARRAEKGKPFA